jgi:L-ascorbate metabolism protein UlaG (beta-lactamase superfamily)
MSVMRELSLSTAGAADVDFTTGSIFFVGTATVIIRYAGFTILTDPNFIHAGDHVHLGYGLTAKRLTNPAIDIEELPPCDFCVLSHYHGDHFDQVAEEKLDKNLPIVTTGHAAKELEERGFTAVIPLDTWETTRMSKDGAAVTITALPAKHGPPVVESLLPEVMGSMLEFQPEAGGTGLRLYITGDTVLIDELADIPARYPDIDLALFHLGGTRIMGLLLTMDAEQGVAALRLINPREVIPIHFNDYEVFRSPLEEFARAVEAAGLAGRVRYLAHGETYAFEVGQAQ